MLSLIATLLLMQAQASPPTASSLFDEGITFEQFMQDVRSQRSTWEANAARANPPGVLVERLKRAGTGLKILAISEAACSDSVQTVPYIAALADRAGVPLRIVTKARGLPVMEQHLSPDGRTATPTIVIIRGGKDVGAWVERPEVLQAWFLANQDLGSQERVSRKTSWYDWDRGATTLAEIVALVERSAAPAHGSN